jgi:hypothetical protein
MYEGTADVIYPIYTTALASIGSVYEACDYTPQKGSSPASVALTRVANVSKSALTAKVTTYELIPQETLVPVHQHSALCDLTAQDIADAYNLAEGATTTSPSEWSYAKNALYELILQRTLQVKEYGYILRRTVLCNSVSSAAASYNNVNKVDTPPNAGGLLGDLPAGEWLKSAPAVRQIGVLPWQNRWQIVDEWQWAKKWSAILYGGSLIP